MIRAQNNNVPLKLRDLSWVLIFYHAIVNAKFVWIDAVLVVKDIIVIYWKKWNYFDLNQFETLFIAGPRSAVGNVSGYRCVSDCRSRGREFDHGPVPYFRGDVSWNDFYGHSPPFRWFIQEGLLSVTSESTCTNYWLTACSSLPRKKMWLGELTVPQWP